MSLIESDLALLRTAALFDLTTSEGRKESVTRLRSLFYQLHQVLQPRSVMEIGAKEATFSRTVKALLPEARCIAFEANPFVFAKQKKNSDPKRQGVEYRNIAVADVTGATKFFVQTKRGDRPVKPTLGSNSLMPRVGDVETMEVEVPCTRIDDYIAANKVKSPKTAWVDVEGAVGIVLPGMETALDGFMMVFIEVEERQFWEGQWLWPQVHAFMVERGFRPVARDFEYDGQNNVLFVRDDILERADVRKALAEFYSGVVPPHVEIKVLTHLEQEELALGPEKFAAKMAEREARLKAKAEARAAASAASS
jgi:FkbM family methyltransferase